MDFFPTNLPGLGWSITRAPEFATRIQTSIAGREDRTLDMPYPRWTWTLAYEFLRDGNSTAFGGRQGISAGYNELRELMGFYARQQGALGTFLYVDPSDDNVTNQGIGVGDGANKAFQLSRTLSAPGYGGLFTEPITQPTQITNIYVNGGAAAYALGAYGVVTLNAAPAAGALVSATFTYAWPVRFVDDTYEFENFMLGLWTTKKIQFKSVLLP